MTDIVPLYKFTLNGKEVYGTHLTKDSAGRWVMEVKGSGDVVSVNQKDLEEVVEYTIQIHFTNNSNVHYVATKGQFVKGDVVMSGIQLGRVVTLDTKSRKGVELPSDMVKVGTSKV